MAPRTRKLVHLVDDDREVRVAMHRTLSSLGFVVRAMENGQELEQMLLSERPDLIMLDVMMPGRSGLELLQHLSVFRRLGSTPVVVMSALPKERLRMPAEFADAPFLGKPFHLEEVRQRVEEAIGPGAPRAGLWQRYE